MIATFAYVALRKKVLTIIFFWLAWFGCGYVDAAFVSGHFYGEFSRYGVESKGSASREVAPLVCVGPLGIPAALLFSDYRPMWDWPRYLLSDFKELPQS